MDAASSKLAHPTFLEQYAATHRFRLGRPGAITIAPDGARIYFLRSGPRSFVRDLFAFELATAKEHTVVTSQQILGQAEEQLSRAELARRERMRLTDRGIAGYGLSPDGRTMLVPLSGKLYLLDRDGGSVRAIESEGGAPIDPAFSPDGRHIAAVRDGDLYVHDIEAQSERRLTQRESELITYGLPEFVAQEEMGRHHGYWWSPDGQFLAVQRTDVTGVERMHIGDLVRPDREPHGPAYPRAGRKNASVQLGIVPVQGGAIRWIEWDRDRYPYLATVRWDRGGSLALVVQNRAQSEVAVLAADAAGSRVLHVEKDTAWINLDQEMPRWLADGSGFLWTTERNGAWQIELRAPDGTLVRALSEPGFGYAGLCSIDQRARHLYVRATKEPTEMHVFRVPLDPSRGSPEQLTQKRGVHAAVFSRNHELYVHATHALDGHWQTVVRKRDGSLIGELVSTAETPPFSPKPELKRAGPDFSTLVLRPRDFDPKKKYPVLVYAYGGPHVQVVQAAPQEYLLQQWFADQGFVVVAIDGRGTPGRGREFERALRGSFIDVPLADQAAALEALLSSDPSLDRERVGIYGWSFGGYLSAMAVLKRPDLYRAAVAGAPVTDWLDYDTHYTERYLGLPAEAPEAYEKSSALTFAPGLERPLLIIHGTSDDNVYFSHAVKLSDVLFRAGKAHEFLPLAGFTHMVPDPLVTRRLYETILSFFVRHLRASR